jgi:hypothetical protein
LTPTPGAGKDATEEFEYYGHSNKAREQMKEFEVGSYEVSSAFSTKCARALALYPIHRARHHMQGGDPAPVQPSQATYGVTTAKSKSMPVKIIQALLPLLVVAIAFAVKTYWATSVV